MGTTYRYDYALATGSAFTTLTGSAFAVDGTDLTKVTGTGSSFDTELHAGDAIRAGVGSPQEIRIVDRVSSSTVLYVTRVFSASGSDSDGSYLALKNLGLPIASDGLYVPLRNPWPRSTFQEYSKRSTQANGLVRGRGWSTATWEWDVLTIAQRTQLIEWIGGASKALTLYTRKRQSASAQEWGLFTGIAMWPEKEQSVADKVLDFVLRWQALVEVT